MKSSNHSSAYRRGVLLGLTMAEIIILIIFLLLLAFATMLEREKKQNTALLKLMDNKSPHLERIVKAISTKEPTLTEDVVLAIEQMPKVVSLIKADDLALSNETVDQTIIRAIEKLKTEKTLNELDGKTSVEEHLAEALRKQNELSAEVENLTNQKSNIIAQLKKAGRGIDWPPCWADKHGKAEYIFQTALTNQGIIITDISPPHRQESKKQLPIEGIILDKAQSIGGFTSQTTPLFNWSRKNECHHFVVVEDRTGANDKLLYKQQRATVEGRFYIFQKSSSTPMKTPTVKYRDPNEVDPNYIDPNLRDPNDGSIREPKVVKPEKERSLFDLFM